jgi:hypothetical protein
LNVNYFDSIKQLSKLAVSIMILGGKMASIRVIKGNPGNTWDDLS